MKAMILAAGKGTRVRPITHEIPKPMIPLVRKPLMESIIEHLQRYGIDQIVVNTSHLAPVIENYFRDGQRYGVQIAYSFEGVMADGQLTGQALGSAGGLRKIQDFSVFFDDTFIVVCGDAWIDLDIDQVVEFHRRRNSVATIVLKQVDRSEVYKYGVVETDGEGRIRRFQEKPSPEQAVSDMINTGIYIFEPKVFDFIPAGEEYDIGGQLLPALVDADMPFYGFASTFQWLDVGSLPDLWSVTHRILRGEIDGYPMPGCEVSPGLRLGINVRLNPDAVEIVPPVVIASGTAVGDGARIVGPALIGANCVIEEGAVVERCIIDDYTRVSGIACVEDRLLFGDQCITPGGEVIDMSEADIGWVIDDARKELELSEEHRLILEMARETGAT
jgi:mannose-1-phosphate guanylyltransferase